jgi:hypothetical protein
MSFSRMRRGSILDAEVGAEEIDHRQEGRRLAVGDGAGLEHHPVRRPVGVSQLPDQPGLADAGLADNGDDLAMPGAGPLEGDAQLVQLPVASNEAGQPAGRGDLQTRPRRGETGELEHFHGLAEPLDGHGAERFHPDVPLHEAEGGGRQQD